MEGFIVKEIVWQLKYYIVEVVHHIVAVEVDMSGVCKRWVPRDNDEQKRRMFTN
jgi:hypothetical protein